MTTAKHSAEWAGRSETARKVVLVGWAAQGVVYATLAWLVLQMAFGSAPQQASTTGALEYLAGTLPGSVGLLVLAVGLLAFAVGRILEVTTLAGPQIDAKDHAKAVLTAVLYVALAGTALSIVGIVGSSSSSGGGSSEKQGSSLLLGLPGGRVLVGIIGLAIIAAGLYGGYRGLQQRFLDTLRESEMSSGVHTAASAIGTAAYVTKGLILVALGWFFLSSAITYDPNQARGLDGALRSVEQASWGPAALAAIAVGLLSYGLFAFLEARYRKVGSSASGLT